MHHEQACAMAAEGYARTTNRPAVVLTTAGPGAINTLNGVFGAYTDSIPMIVIAGQAKSETLRETYKLEKLRQLGDQEAQMIEMVSGITKDRYQFSKETTGKEFLSKVDELVDCAVSGRPGPVWLEIPVDVQGVELGISKLEIEQATFKSGELPNINQEDLAQLISMLNQSKRPVILMGSGVRLSGVQSRAVKMAEILGIPTWDDRYTTWKLYCSTM